MKKILYLPGVFLDHECILKMITLLFPCQVKKDFKLDGAENRIIAVQAFRENRHGIRIRFF